MERTERHGDNTIEAGACENEKISSRVATAHSKDDSLRLSSKV